MKSFSAEGRYSCDISKSMVLKRTSHAVYDTKYHLVWAPKYRKWILRGDIQRCVEGVIQEIAENHEFEIDELEVAKDHVHIFLSFAPRYSISRVVGIIKSISAKEVFRQHPEVKRELWAGEFWEDGYFVRTVGDKVTDEMIRKYIKHHRSPKAKQLKIF
jgi:putative transposase